MKEITFTSEEIAYVQGLYGKHADAMPLALYILHMKGTGYWGTDRIVDELWRKINALYRRRKTVVLTGQEAAASGVY